MKLKIELDMDNDAFQTNPETELKEVLRNVIHKIQEGKTYSALVDANGKRLGTYELTNL